MSFFTNYDQFWTALFNTVIPIFFAGLTFLVKKGFAYLDGKTALIQDQYVRSGIIAAEDEAERLTSTIVASLEQTLVQGLKSQNGDVLSPSDAKRVKDEALAKIKGLLSLEAKEILADHKTDVAEYIGHLIEAEVFRNKSGFVTAKIKPIV